MKLDIDEIERKAKSRLAISADIDLTNDDIVLALIARIPELEAEAQIVVGEQDCDATDECHRALHAHLAAVVVKGTVLP